MTGLMTTVIFSKVVSCINVECSEVRGDSEGGPRADGTRRDILKSGKWSRAGDCANAAAMIVLSFAMDVEGGNFLVMTK